uniref:Ovarian tumor protein n=1 Tax=Bemisia tabaci TaxID=7038 RepID=A0A3R5SQS3_BEMTA|nr:ovarian tumor protein [Bemisia tabaci]
METLKGELITSLINPSQLKSWMKPVDPVDVWLDHQGLYRKHTARDASCLYRIIAEQVYLTQMFHMHVRKQCIEFCIKNPKYLKRLNFSSEDVIEHLQNLREPSGELEIQLLSIIHKYDFVLHKEIGHPPSSLTNYGYNKVIHLWASKDSHYDSVHSKQHIANAAFCQAIVYEILYKRVFKLQEVDFAVNKMLHDKVTRYPREISNSYGYAMRLEMREQCLNAKELLKMDITPFPYKVAKSLDPNIYRNVEFDTWNDGRRGFRLTYWSNRELKVGAKCLVTLNPETVYVAHIQKMSEDHGPVTIFVEALGQMLSVPYEKLSLLPEIRSSLNTYQEKCLQSGSSNAPSDEYDDVDYPDNSLYVGPTPSTTNNDDPQVYHVSSSSDHFSKECEENEEKSHQFTNISKKQEPLSTMNDSKQDSHNPGDGYHNKHESQPASSERIEKNEQTSLMNLIDGVSPITEFALPLASDTSSNQTSNPIVNLSALESVMHNGSDLPLSDIPTLRFFYNLGVSYLRSCNTMMCPPSPCLPYSFFCSPIPGNVSTPDPVGNSPSLPPFSSQHITLSSVTGASIRQRREAVMSSSGSVYVPEESCPSIQTFAGMPQNAKTVQSTKLENEPLIHPQQVTRLSTLMQSQPSTPSLFSMPGTPPPNSIIPLTPGGLYSPSTPVYYSPAECSDSSFYPPVGYVDCACLPPDTPSGIYQSVYPPQFTFPEPVVYQQMVPQSPTVSNSFST